MSTINQINPAIDHSKLAKIARELKGSSQKRINYILETANQELKINVTEINDILMSLTHSGQFLGMAGISYANPDTRLLKAALAHYYLTN